MNLPSLFTNPVRFLCRFLIHRYMGQYLRTELSSDQLELRLADGTASVQSVNLNTEYINEMLKPLGIVSLEEGYVREITASVPWKKLMSESTVIKIDGLELTLRPLTDVSKSNAQELVSSMIGSIASSIDLARSVITDDDIAGGTDAGVEQFATLIDHVISRIKLIFDNVAIRIESQSESLCTGLEIQIDRIEFLDEQLEMQEQQQSFDGETITQQPSSLYTVTDINKILHIQGVKLFTDIWSPLKDPLIVSGMQQSETENEIHAPDMSNSLNFQSCYSHFASNRSSHGANGNGGLNRISTNPVPFAELFSDKNTIRFRINNATFPSHSNVMYNKRVDIELQVGSSLYFFLTPSQIDLIKDLLARMAPKYKNIVATSSQTLFGDHPMRNEHFQKITDQIQGDLGLKAGVSSGTLVDCLSGNSWSGAEQFFELSLDSKLEESQGRLRSSSLSTSRSRTYGNLSGSSTTLVENRPDVFSFTIRVPSIFGIISHRDPLSISEQQKLSENSSNEFSLLRNTISEMSKTANSFFNVAEALKLQRGLSMSEKRKYFDELYHGDQLRIMSNKTVFSLNVINEAKRTSFDFSGRLEECDLIEALIDENNEENLLHYGILNVSDKSPSSNDVLNFRVKNQLEHQNEYVVEINVEECNLDLDPSIIDRLSKLICTQPCFFKYIKNSTRPGIASSPEGEVCGLRDNILPENFESDLPLFFQIKVFCRNVLVYLRIPVVDLSEKAPAYSKRSLHPEFFKFFMDAVSFEVSSFKPSELLTQGVFNMQCKSIIGSFIGDPKTLDCAKDEMQFFFANSVSSELLENRHTCKLKIEYDLRNQTLRSSVLNFASASQGHHDGSRNMNDSFFHPRDEDKTDGPFSQTTNYFADTKLIIAGSRSELSEFSQDCIQSSKINISISLPLLNICLPSHSFYEVLYNRTANDLALWEVRSPYLKTPKVISEDPNTCKFIRCDIYEPQERSDLSESFDEYSDLNALGNNSNIKSDCTQYRQNSHYFTIDLQVDRAKLLFQTSVSINEDGTKANQFFSQIGTDFVDGRFFIVYGYKEDPNVLNFYLTSKKVELYHRNLIGEVVRFPNDVKDVHNFSAKHKADIYVEEVPDDQHFTYVNDDNLTISVRLAYRPEENFRDMLLAVTLRNTLLHLHLFSNKKHFWGFQFADFFNAVDYGVPGYVLPALKVDLNLHLTSVVVGYDHSLIVPHSPMQVRLAIGSCDLSAVIMQEMERFRFQCLLQDTKLWLNKKSPNFVRFEPTRQGQSSCAFVKVLFIGLLHFNLYYTVGKLQNAIGPTLELSCINDLITVWLCSDTMTEFINILSEILQSEVVNSFLADQKEAKKKALNELVKISNMCSSMNETLNVSSFPTVISKEKSMQELKPGEEDKLIKILQHAMLEVPSVQQAQTRKRADLMSFNVEEEVSSAESTSVANESTDDEFILIEKISSKMPKKLLNSRFDPDFEIISRQIRFPSNSENESLLPELSLNRPPPILRYIIKDVSLKIYFFGGNDFGTSYGAQKTYSQWDTRRLSDDCVKCDSQGGRFRDHTVCVETRVTKLSFMYEVFNSTSPILSFSILNVEDVEVLDHLLVSNIHKMVYQYTSSEMPKKVSKPFFSVQIFDDQQGEGKMKISLLPIRLNFDQDTLEFLQEFLTSISYSIFHLKFQHPNTSVDVTPIMEIPKSNLEIDQLYSEISSLRTSKPGGISFQALKAADEERTNIELLQSSQPLINFDDLFSEEDVHITDSFCQKFGKSSRNQEDIDAQENITSNSSSEGNLSEESNKEPLVTDSLNLSSKSHDEKLHVKAVMPKNPNREVFFKEFTFAPPCFIRLDYVGKRVKTDQGALFGLLIGLTNLHKTELILKELHNERGMIGIGRCLRYAVDEWVNDIRTKQIPNVLGSYAPISALVQLGQSFRDLFALPMVELNKEDGNVIKGIQLGASNFSWSATTAVLDVTQRFASLIQSVAEFAFDIVTPDYAFHRQRKLLAANHGVQVAGDFREGLTMAYDTVREGILDTAQTIHAAMEEDRACGQWGVGILRHVTPSAIKPIVIASKATVQVIDGIKNQFRPDDYREEMEKWRKANRATSSTHLNLKRQSGSIPPLSSSLPNAPKFEYPTTSSRR